MSAKVRFVRDPSAEQKIRSATGSMANVGLAIRNAADAVRDEARALAKADAAEATSRRDTLKEHKFDPSTRENYLKAKAAAYALSRHSQMINAFETGGKGAEVVGHVVADYAASAAIEFGGTDRKVLLGFGDDAQPLEHHAHGHLRRAMRG